MPNPATRIEVDPQTAEALTGYAASLGLSVAEFLKKHFSTTNGDLRIDDIDGWLDEMSEGSAAWPALPRDFSSRDLYADHD